MDGWHLWKRVWYGVSRKKHGPRHYAVASRTRSAPVSGTYAPHGRYVLGTRHYSFHSHMASGTSQRPKVLLDVDCSNLLTGGSGQYENFSSTCWLEDHLHHFGEPVSLSAQASTSSIYWNVGEEEEEGEGEEEDQRDSGDSDFVRPQDRMEGDNDSPAARVAENVGREEEEEEEVGRRRERREEDGRVVVHRDVSARSSVPVVTNVSDVSRRRRHPPLRRTVAVSEPPPYITDPPPSYEEAIAGNSVIDCGNSDFMW